MTCDCDLRFCTRSEAKQHQDNTHHQHYSWSCAFLREWQGAFQPPKSLSHQIPDEISSDICGYCGEAFPNNHEPDWESRRVYHLITVHKCGECNEAQEFRRGDHFQKHLIDSHSGSKGPWMTYLEKACRKEGQIPDSVATIKPPVLDEYASHEAYRVSSNETHQHMDDASQESEHSINSRTSQQSTPSAGSQVSDGSIEAGHSVFHGMDDLIEEHFKEAFPKPRLITRKRTTPAKESYKTGVRNLLYKIHKRYALLYSAIDVDTCERDESLVVLYDDMKLAFNGLMSQILVAQASEEVYTELTLQVSEFGCQLDQYMGLEREDADSKYVASQEKDRTWPPQLAHDKSKHMGTKKDIKKLLSRNKSSKSRGAASLVSKGTGWLKSRTVGGKAAVPESGSLCICDCSPKGPKKFDNPDDLR
ncbi:uncharacterized protein N7479_006575 [Penicillium vulpinum]|uniref:uncharacterized protein n=1 Tax=Penicillium vulpinum TaxID=29845 RepID=UPI002549AAAC|nr:uncharacterized protein N7479_006575 [Penicillium vulpinum]KAJ5959425.1 hypothetical protein N7479_006575 [Penicillium vulpinum]